MPFLTAAGHRLEYEWIDPAHPDRPVLVFLHEGLGSVAMWRGFPNMLAEATGCGALVYSRWGHGASDPITVSRSEGFMHDEALVTLPEVLRTFRIERPILVGHSDGGSIALIYTGAGSGPVEGLILEAPHVFVEDLSIRSIEGAKTSYETTDLKSRLARYHGSNTDGVFRGWNDVWLSPGFRAWNIEEYLPSIDCPILLIQGDDDEYGTGLQVETIAEQVSGPVETLLLPGCGHSPHRDRHETVLGAAAGFIRRLAETSISDVGTAD